MHLVVMGIGEVLWDCLPEGRRLGGAPANFALHARSLHADAVLISRVGRDPLGAELRQGLATQGLPLALVQADAAAPTGTVSVTLSGQGIPSYTIHEHVAWDRIEATPEAIQAAEQADAVCFGSLAQRSATSRQAIQALVAGARPGALRVFDINLRQHFHTPTVIERSLQLANVLKLSDGELPVLAGQFGLEGSTRNQLEMLARRFGLTVIALTCGAKGSVLWREGQWSERPSPPVEVKDTVGAGDSFAATLVMGLLRGLELDAINERANAVAAFVCSQHGATPELPQHLRELFRGSRA